MADQYDQKQGTAKALLVHYMQTVFEAAGLKWDSDNTGEIEEAVDAIVNAVVSEVKAEYKKGEFPNKYI